MDKKKILICGAGCIGTYLGVLLNSKGHEVFLLGRRKLKETSDRIAVNGKIFSMPKKIFSFPKKEKFDFIFITSKLYDFEKMIKQINKNKLDARFLSSIQNGLVDNTKYKKILHHRLVPITVFYGLNFEKGKIAVRKTSMGWKTEDSKEGKLISRIISEAGIPCKAEKNFDSLRAEKTIVNCCLNAMSAIERKQFCELFKDKKTLEMIDLLFEECYNILKKEHKLEDSEVIKKRMFKNWKDLKHYSSTFQDMNSGRKNEVIFFNGYITELGEKYNLPAKYNQEILRKIKIMEKNGKN